MVAMVKSAICALFVALLWLRSGDAFSLLVTGDVNLNPNLSPFVRANYSYIWGDMIDVLRAADVLAINHESTLAGIKISDPNVIQFEDPLDYTATYADAGVDFITQANNHEYDFGLQGMANTVRALNGLRAPLWGGLGNTAADVRRPVVVKGRGGNPDVAFFTMVVDECWVWPNGTLYLDGCTCGDNAGKVPSYQCYAAGSPGIPTGLWYQWLITPAFISNVTATIGAYKKAHPNQFVVVYLHVGPNFQWQPYASHEWLLRNISTVSDLVWGTSSHHVQRFEVFKGTPIIYGLGDLLFRHLPGVDDFCPLYAIPCEQYRPELALSYQFNIRNGRVDLSSIVAFPSIHDDFQTHRVSEPTDVVWLANTMNEMSCPGGACFTYNRTMGAFQINIKQK